MMMRADVHERFRRIVARVDAQVAQERAAERAEERGRIKRDRDETLAVSRQSRERVKAIKAGAARRGPSRKRVGEIFLPRRRRRGAA